jgi:hypothetical protein
MSYAGYGFHNMSVSEQKVVKHPASSLLVIDSEDRNIASSIDVSSSSPVEYQPWNNFQIQTPDRLATGGINRIALKSVRFPWYIPNITSRNYEIAVSINSVVTPVDLAIRFTSPEDAAQQMTTVLYNSGTSTGIQVNWNNTLQSFTWTAVGLSGASVIIVPLNSNISSIGLTQAQYVNNPSLAKSMGFSLATLYKTYTIASASQTFIVNSPTDFLYTRYVDIVSPRLLQYRRMMDGASKNASKRPLVTRIYCANENSQNSYDLSGNIIPIGTQPFLIHRKIEEKSIAWNSEATVDYLDFQVFDEYGQLVALPGSVDQTLTLLRDITYPSFQMTFVLSE